MPLCRLRRALPAADDADAPRKKFLTSAKKFLTSAPNRNAQHPSNDQRATSSEERAGASSKQATLVFCLTTTHYSWPTNVNEVLHYSWPTNVNEVLDADVENG